MLYGERKKPRPRKSWKAAALGIIALAVIAFFFRIPLLVQLGQALVIDDPLQETDAIIVLMGSIPDRVVHGVDLYQAGYSDRLVMVCMREFEDYDVVEERGLKIPATVEINKDIALQLGVPEDAIVVLDYGSDSTYDEAVAVKEYLDAGGLKSVIVVTSRYHSARSKKTFERVLGDGVEVLSSPSPYDPFGPESWWEHRAQARSVFLEYQKFINFYLFQR